MNNIELYNNDCFEILKDIQDNYIDLFILDLPYANMKFGKCTELKWDTPFNLDKMWIEIKRIMKPCAIMVFFCDVKFGYCLINSNPKWFKYNLIWKKGNKSVGFLSANKRQLRSHEEIYIFKNRQGTYNPQKTKREKDYKHSGKRSSEEIYSNILNCKKLYKKEDGKYPTSILDFQPETKTIHNTQKPVLLIENLIKTYSNDNDKIIDFTMGSGTTGIASINVGNRYFIGIEKDKDIYDKAYKRIENHYKAVNMQECKKVVV